METSFIVSIALNVICLFVFIYIFMYKIQKSNVSVSNFINEEPKYVYDDLVYELGQPHVCINQPGGFAVWFPKHYDPSFPCVNIILKDERIEHKQPYLHYDFLYATIIVDVTDEQLERILKVCKSVYYDRGTRELTVRCNSLHSTKTLLKAILEQIHSNRYNESTEINEIKILSNVINEDGSVHKKNYNELKQNLLKEIDDVNKERLIHKKESLVSNRQAVQRRNANNNNLSQNASIPTMSQMSSMSSTTSTGSRQIDTHSQMPSMASNRENFNPVETKFDNFGNGDTKYKRVVFSP